MPRRLSRSCTAPPGYSLLLSLPVLAARGDPVAAVDWTRLLHLLLLAGVLGLCVHAVLRRGGGWVSAAALTGLLITNPLLDMTLRWLQVESVVALVLLGLWIGLSDMRKRGGLGEALLFGLLAGITTLLRAELSWLPWLWILVMRRGAGRTWFATALVIWVGVVAPWAVRNAMVTGDPFFSVQAFAEHLKDTPGHEGLLPYLSLEGEHWARTLLRDPALLLNKAGDGLIYQAVRLDNWIPWLLLPSILLLAAVERLRGRTSPSTDQWRPPVLLVTTWLMLILLYAPLSHDLRHAAPLVPVALLEAWRLLEGTWTRLAGRSLKVVWVPAAVAAVCVAFGPRMPGWDAARESAIAERSLTEAMIGELDVRSQRPLICDQGAVFWYGKRKGVITPRDRETLGELQRRIPELRNAQLVSRRLPPLGPGTSTR